MESARRPLELGFARLGLAITAALRTILANRSWPH
jgi:hypothetical protein